MGDETVNAFMFSALLIIVSTTGLFYFLLKFISSFKFPKDKSDIFDFERDLKKSSLNEIKEYANSENATLLGVTSSKKKIYVKHNAKHVFVCGTTGSGKTVALSNFIKSGMDNNFPMLIIDGKGDPSENSLLDMVTKLKGNRKVYIINLNDPIHSDKYNPFKETSFTVIKDMLVNMTTWSEEHYKLNAERYVQKLIKLLSDSEMPLSFKTITDYMPVNKFTALSAELLKNKKIDKAEHIQNLEIAESSGKTITGASARFSNLIESEIGAIFDEDGIDIFTALKENAIILFILNPLLYPEVSPLFGNLIVIDSKKAVSKLYNDKPNRTFFIFDEINVYATNTMLDLVNKSRSANVTCVLATQSLSDLDASNGEAFKEQVIENCNNYIIMRQNSAKNAENLANIIGTKSTMNVTYQLKSENNLTEDTGYGSARLSREYEYHPDIIKNLSTGEAIFVAKENKFKCRLFINYPFEE